MYSPNLYGRLAVYYDMVHSGRDYLRETTLAREAFRRFYGSAGLSTLDLLCGTGGHTICAARLGLEAVGLDVSEDMLAIARKKAKLDALDIQFELGDCRSLGYSA